jgi:hypothetical protein
VIFSTFRTPRIHRHRRDGVENPSGGGGRRLWVLSRALCRYRVFPLLDDPSPSKRLAAIDLKIAEWSPWAETARLVHEEGRRTGVWIWDRAGVEQEIAAAGLMPDKVTVVPETALQPRGNDGLRHVQTFDGSEGQWWVEGLLAASRWWPEPPSEAEWVRFQRAAGVPPEAARERAGPPESLPQLTRPWLTGTSNFRSGAPAGRRLVPAYWTLAGAYVLLIGVFIGQTVGDQIALGRIDRDLAAADAAAQPRLAERAEARSGLDAVNRLQALSPYPSQLELLAKISELIPRNGTKVSDWNFQSGELEFTVNAPTGADAPAYVKVVQSIAGFTNVSAEHVGGDKVLKVKLKVAPR